MTESAVRLGDAGELFLSGVLDYRTGPELRKQGQALINSSNADRKSTRLNSSHWE